MKVVLLVCLSIPGLTSCAQKGNTPIRIQVAEKSVPAPNEAVATFAQGCFWHTEIVFQSLVGVRDAVSGYSGGRTENPSYDRVSGGSTGHAESVQVYY